MMVVEPQGLNFVEQKQNWQSYNAFLEKKNAVKEILNVIYNQLFWLYSVIVFITRDIS